MSATVGVIGGMGPLATAAFLAALVEATEVDREQDHLHVIVDSDPAIPDRTAFLLGHGDDPRPALIRAARRLESAGAELLVMPCNTANVFADDVAASVRVPLIAWLDVTAALVASGGIQRTGLLATTGTVETNVYQRLLVGHGLAVVVPADRDQRMIDRIIYGPDGVKVSGRPSEGLRKELLAVAQRLADVGAESIVLGCTELPLVIRGDDARWPIPAVDPAFAVAQETVRRAGGRVRHEGAARWMS